MDSLKCGPPAHSPDTQRLSLGIIKRRCAAPRAGGIGGEEMVYLVVGKKKSSCSPRKITPAWLQL